MRMIAKLEKLSEVKKQGKNPFQAAVKKPCEKGKNKDQLILMRIKESACSFYERAIDDAIYAHEKQEGNSHNYNSFLSPLL